MKGCFGIGVVCVCWDGVLCVCVCGEYVCVC